MIEIKLTRGKTAFLDNCDSDLAEFKWCAIVDPQNSVWYAQHREPNKPDGSIGDVVKLHRVIGARIGIRGNVDHRNRNGLDNRRSNLRSATHSQNAMNRRRNTLNRSGFKGVGYDRDAGLWRARVGIANRRKHLGRFISVVDAALAYDRAARMEFGEFARINFEIDPIVHAAISLSAT
jgi:hypothetical protein